MAQKFVRFGDNQTSNPIGTANTGKEEPKLTQTPVQKSSFSKQQAQVNSRSPSPDRLQMLNNEDIKAMLGNVKLESNIYFDKMDNSFINEIANKTN